LPDGPNGNYPGAYQPLTLYRNATDSMQLAFDGAGVLRFAIAPGIYRIASVARWQGREYRWSMALPVASGMRTVALTAANASVTSVTPSRVAREDATTVAAPGEPYDRKSGTVATLLSLLVTGGGQMYAGRVNKGIGLLALGLAGGVVTVVSLNEYNKNDYPGVDNSAGTAGIITGVSISLGAYIYSIATANHDVHQ